ncbi:MAG: peptide chain release factor 1 [Candidatus Eisenbacteria bacterium]|uniref:Peptide chain release factor 1 n=1 Tax=Eiseniibacteriota bacterium TaxID=2212470 RepID=A0A956SG08_UNCEI|nr:peptide chain release factor 1 [Candidatus Eisenbacteria bacterium]MCB9463751.1 peptide chain release factor 1 [Candidatus Eisenbacteria bacterium]
MIDLLRNKSQLADRLEEINRELMDPKVLGDAREMKRLGRERNRLDAILEAMNVHGRALENVEELDEALQGDDAELAEMAELELPEAREAVETSEQELKLLLTPRDPADDRNAIVEIRAGAGGDEATLFARDLFRMYLKFAETQGFKIEEMDSSQNEIGGLKEMIFAVHGEEAYGTFKFESGVHRVQRVPATEAQGRIHTSAVSVAVLPEAEEVDVDIEEKDLKIDVFRSSGPGGQSVNTTDSAVRIKHLPTGIVVQCQDERSQLKNKNKAMKILMARLLDHERQKKDEETAAARRSMVSTGDRSAKVRTYNFPQGRVTDHRINLTLYNLPVTMEGDILPLIQALRLADSEARLAAEVSKA